VPVRLYVGDDWAQDHHDIEVMDEAGKVLAKRRLLGRRWRQALAAGATEDEITGVLLAVAARVPLTTILLSGRCPRTRARPA
jgi:hypothetical protein